MAFLLRPAAIVLDEPTTGLDVTTQAHVLETVRELCAAHDTAAVYVSHDLAAVASLAHRVVVLYAGRVVEDGPGGRAASPSPAHPYTRKLVGAIPHVEDAPPPGGDPRPRPAPGHRPDGLRLRAPLRPRARRCLRRRAAAARRGRTCAPRARASARSELADRRPSPCRRGAAASPTRPRCSRCATSTRSTADARSSTASRSRCGPASASRSSASRAPARRRSRARSRGSTPPRTGEILLDGTPLAPDARARPRETCRRLQYVFQSAEQRAQPAAHGRRDPADADRPLLGAARRGRRRARRLAARPRRAPGRRGDALPRRALGRRAPARRDRPRARGGARRDRLRRDHLGARHLRAGGDRRAARRAPRPRRRRAPLRHPQPRPRPHDRRPGDRARRGPRRRDRRHGRRARRPRRTPTTRRLLADTPTLAHRS